MTQKDVRQALIDELSKIENKHTGEYAIAEKPLSWQNSGAIADYILENFVSKDEILKARPKLKDIPTINGEELIVGTEEIRGYNQALKDCQQAIDQLRQELTKEMK